MGIKRFIYSTEDQFSNVLDVRTLTLIMSISPTDADYLSPITQPYISWGHLLICSICYSDTIIIIIIIITYIIQLLQ